MKRYKDYLDSDHAGVSFGVKIRKKRYMYLLIDVVVVVVCWLKVCPTILLFLQPTLFYYFWDRVIWNPSESLQVSDFSGQLYFRVT